jgi:hypothetical protein
LKHRAGWSGELIDVFPEVYSGSQAFELLKPVMIEHGRRSEEVDEARMLLERRGAVYDSRSNAVFVRKYLPGPAAGESARFLRAALTGRLFVENADLAGDAVAATYGAAFNEALAFLGARLVDPTSACFDGDVDRDDDDTGRRREWIAAHRAFERTRGRRPPEALSQALRVSRTLRRQVARELGRRVGATFWEGVRAGTATRRQLRSLFTQSLDADGLVGQVLGWLRRDEAVAAG